MRETKGREKRKGNVGKITTLDFTYTYSDHIRNKLYTYVHVKHLFQQRWSCLITITRGILILSRTQNERGKNDQKRSARRGRT